MWSFRTTTLNDGIQRIALYTGDDQLTYKDVIPLWQESQEFRSFYLSVLQSSPFSAFFWENPPIASLTLDQPYEFVLIENLQLARITADSSPFQDRFNPIVSDETIVTFGSLDRDAELIVPCPIAPCSLYTHFALFVQYAPENQKHDLFIFLAKALENRISEKPIWVSASGLGVYWLHIRLDVNPKYYSYQPYCQFHQ